MKKSLYILFFAILLVGCDKGFEELNVDPTRPSQIDVTTKLTSTLLYTSGGRYENWRANLIYSSTMMQHFATTAGYWAGDKYTWNQGYASSLIDAYYGSAVKTVEDMLVQIDEEGLPEEMRSITRIMRVFIYHRLTDLYGDVPYSEAGKAYIEGVTRPKYDRQSDIYADMLKELEEATAALGSGASGYGSADVMFNGDQGKWKRFGYSMMLRLGFRLIKVDPAASQQWVTKAINGGVMTSNDDTAYIEHTAGPDGVNRNGNGEVFTADASMRMSKTFIDFLQDDPRLTVLASLPENTGEEDANEEPILRTEEERLDPAMQKGLPNGLDADLLQDMTGEENIQAYSEPNRLLITAEDTPMFFQTYAEVEFMLAEAGVRWGLAGDPAAHYEAGVRAAMKMLELYGEGGIIADADIDAYLAANPYDSANALEQINTQYWAATFLNEFEAFANWRRVGFPDLVPVNYPGNVTNSTIPRRLTYSTSEQSVNKENYEAAVAAQGPDELTTRVWWDVQ
ncbi:SusD/RagB family nutrient-binding outer membrane lipoprotein [Galbibacter sp. EGI 63066]|uniref:SusD/RagB family nutrient-binding outer membrane lipoprotein n=1 Tax=Galbibacter sp. EGI 63066 TaxID=2993559 RepID=UPI0022497372|nr:SusD/RagB family nutrient-binding outer membrane lipoprotein [Galbibacter sp. EGI 63066]MCX2681630.1 SusD/RagB family nutrient-binding outer membrane lipoprotein [Galbibacter sp. EGI 63066]